MYGNTSERSEQGYILAPGELASARWGEERRKRSRASGRAFFMVSFLCTSKEKKPAVGQPPTRLRPRRRHNEKKPPKGGFCYLHPGLRITSL